MRPGNAEQGKGSHRAKADQQNDFIRADGGKIKQGHRAVFEDQQRRGDQNHRHNTVHGLNFNHIIFLGDETRYQHENCENKRHQKR